MSNINNQIKKLYSIEAVQDLSQESAAAVTGGADVTLWSRPGPSGAFLELNSAVRDLRAYGFANRTSAIQVQNNQTWRFYTGRNFTGRFFDVGPDEGRGVLPGFIDNNIESLRAIT